MRSGDLHSALRTTVVADLTEGTIQYKHVRLQHGKDNFVDTLHACPLSISYGVSPITDFLHFLGFSQSPCAFHVSGVCYCRTLPPDYDTAGLARAISSAYEKFKRGSDELKSCGLLIGRSSREHRTHGNGHLAPKSERMKESEDNFFRFVFTWIDGAEDKGWTTHYRAKHMPLSPEFQAALDFLGGFSWFAQCPEFDFEGCWWRFTSYRDDEDEVFNRTTDYAHRCFDAHAAHFSPGLQHLLAAHADLEPYDLSFLSVQTPAVTSSPPTSRVTSRSVAEPRTVAARVYRYDVAVSFAGSERTYAEELAKRVRNAGFGVFYDGFYPEQLWGKDLAAFFDRIYRKDSRFCVMFISREYAERMWTSHERKSAQARAVQEKGREYILPIRVDETDLDGLPPTIGYVSLGEYSIEQIATLLVGKLKTVT